MIAMCTRQTLLASCALLVSVVVSSGARSMLPVQTDQPRDASARTEDEDRRPWLRDYHVRDENTIVRTLVFAGTGDRTLDVRAIDGSIRVVGADQPDVQLYVHRVVRAETDDDLDAADHEVTLDITDGAARLEAIVRARDREVCGEPSPNGQNHWYRPHYTVTYDFAIEVPRDTRLRLCTINGREILIEGTRGGFDLENINGRITMPNVSGSGRARTVNGPVIARFVDAPREASEFKTVNGDVIVGFSGDLSADLKMKTFNGGLFTDFDVQALPQPVAAAEQRNGRFVFRSNQFTHVCAGRGGPELTFETLNGSVRVVRAVR